MNESLKILLGEDEYFCMIGLKNNLKKLGYSTIETVSDGKELVKMAEENKPDLIITDINMPLLDGIEAIKIINEEMCIPTIIVSGYYGEELIDKATKQGIFNYLIKPVEIWDLKAAIEVTMSKFKELQNIRGKLDDTKRFLQERKYIEKAKGIIMSRFNLNEAKAMKKMQKMSSDNNKKMIIIAKEIINANKLLS